MMRFQSSVLCIALVALAIAAANADDRIVNLPGLPASLANLEMYSGAVVVNATHQRSLFYMLAMSQGDKNSDPLVAFLNGGPGCSSLGGGMMSECGPFFPDANGNLLENPNSWNKIANLLVVESPSGVGFSTSQNTADYNTGDVQTAQDWLAFLLIFLAKYPQFANRPFHIAGESYGGHYIPQLAKAILDSNAAGINPKINLVSYMAGNPWTDTTIDNMYTAQSWWARAINSYETWNGMATYCDFGKIGPLAALEVAQYNAPDPLKCQKFVTASTNEMGNIDIYEIYQDVCLAGPDGRVGARNNHGAHLLKALAKGPDAHLTILGHLGRRILEAEKSRPQKLRRDPPVEPCIDDFVQTYLNRADVQAAIHAPTLSYGWMDCSNIVNYSYNDLLASVLPLIQTLTKSGIRMLMYTGDHDGIIASLATTTNVRALNLTVVQNWRPWIGSDQQVAGFVETYNGMTLATVRGAGHMVPYIQPARAFDLFSRWVNNKPL
ncbi:hypothetical protein CAOG_08988 [Capsaspora owczarzaki ATCC 30864]|uniref:Carboxypeptidase n=1 Tax=Capsaspora owczarzaki (strain ATCC 30864) TaxID=595528 RepID=A0A0D2WVH1_CAPO3|nr:hypothetical protein CAOG_08988 [Capsaspora owczarzaki ATCC 30864]KJE96178.1 hypothetical protein CAOG_008988 [Capsaspora owczarzaki ATCC 30864]|eukprot:XP_011270666.1 hypothetical protein CAOG_08988 [Capsaspora owczarzaki ATCC 30864]